MMMAASTTIQIDPRIDPDTARGSECDCGSLEADLRPSLMSLQPAIDTVSECATSVYLDV